MVKKSGGEGASGTAASSRTGKRKLDSGVLFVEATYNNTKVSLSDPSGNVVTWSSSGSLGFSGAKKGTPFAAAKVGELIGERASQMGVKEVSVVVKGVGAGRESSIRAFSTKGIQINGIKDMTPVPHNGPRPPKPRRI
ncbi:30S ribosomal protein S11 [Candidatus Adlerbacteria bacterium RIFCSPHIGHO2_02_FULL_54_18]|uniref:Small ribosomal subunit protein uS11 n=1 Tax=Candidatus Adlerbacteria bacterium RIFCSPHIGHO2_02_FULL_54_18 TaxID=1797241 RepID=A0A1F4Y1M4_9BACT|nr:MAG: 30S ribosomal protein S11 [Candidatus Adlerbacteria bacterium RIFCSPHIGHO2_02_FULL_54_18]